MGAPQKPRLTGPPGPHRPTPRRRVGPAGWFLAALALTSGCGQPRGLAPLEARPTAAEVPRMQKLTRPRSISPRVGVEGRPQPRIVLVPDLSQPHYTPEQRRVLGLDQPRTPDVFEKLYPPQPGPAQGVSRDRAGATVGVGASRAATVARGEVARRAAISHHDLAGPGVGVSMPARKAAISLLRPVDPWGYGPAYWLSVGVGLPRTGAARSSAIDY